MFIALLYRGFKLLLQFLSTFFIVLLFVTFFLYGCFILNEWDQYWMVLLLQGN
jgi:hypothetical protein